MAVREDIFANLAPQYRDRKSAAAAIVPVPYDRTSTWIKGADRGPSALIAASAHMELYDIETDSEVYRHGILTDKPVLEASSPGAMIEAVEKRVSNHLSRNRFTVVIGGEHSVAVGSIYAHRKALGPFTVLQLDAHADLRDELNGSRFNHGCVMARVRERCPVVQVGVRSMDVSEKNFFRRDRMFFARDIRDNDAWIRRAVAALSRKVYVTIDLDVFDPAIMPSTGTPEPGGLQWQPVLRLLREVVRKRDLIGFDVVELCPNPRNKAPDFLAAKLVYVLLTYRFLGRS